MFRRRVAEKVQWTCSRFYTYRAPAPKCRRPLEVYMTSKTSSKYRGPLERILEEEEEGLQKVLYLQKIPRRPFKYRGSVEDLLGVGDLQKVYMTTKKSSKYERPVCGIESLEKTLYVQKICRFVYKNFEFLFFSYFNASLENNLDFLRTPE